MISQRKKNSKNNTETAQNIAIAMIVSQYNRSITLSLKNACYKTLLKHGVLKKNIKIYDIPGAFEIPLIAQIIAKQKKFHAIIALGAIIKGETYHFELIANACAWGCQKVALDYNIPVIFEVLACYNIRQAKIRSGNNSYNRGIEAATTALEMTQALKTRDHKN